VYPRAGCSCSLNPAGLEQALGDVVDEVPEPESEAAQVLEAVVATVMPGSL
jgi:hypothetical protein